MNYVKLTFGLISFCNFSNWYVPPYTWKLFPEKEL